MWREKFKRWILERLYRFVYRETAAQLTRHLQSRAALDLFLHCLPPEHGWHLTTALRESVAATFGSDMLGARDVTVDDVARRFEARTGVDFRTATVAAAIICALNEAPIRTFAWCSKAIPQAPPTAVEPTPCSPTPLSPMSM